MEFGRDCIKYDADGERQEQDRAKNTKMHSGKEQRHDENGKPPADNPFAGRPGYLPEIYSVGHRSPQGLAVHPMTGELWENEHGPLGGDEINIVRAGMNYGWPLVTYGKNYDGTAVSESSSRDGFEPPFMFWVPSIAISGLSFYTGDRLAAWKGNAFVGSMMEGRTRATGHVQRITFAENGQPIQREPILAQLRQRIRDVRPGPDGLLYVLTDQNPGVLLRIEPAE
jgi:glucose/arabinose dehydrogenase